MEIHIKIGIGVAGGTCSTNYQNNQRANQIQRALMRRKFLALPHVYNSKTASSWCGEPSENCERRADELVR